MRRILAAVSVLLSFAAPLAAETVTASGTIEAVDVKADTITVRRKTAKGEKTAQFRLARTTKVVFNGEVSGLHRFEVGQKVEITYDNAAKQVIRIEAWPLAPTADNVPPEGFVALFNGKDLSGWRGVPKPPLDNPAKRAQASRAQLAAVQREADAEMRKHWSAKDGMLIFDGHGFDLGTQHGFDLATKEEYGDFELWLDWKIEPRGDSGVFLRGMPQVQIWDARAIGVGSGGLKNNKQYAKRPGVVADKPIGEWNTFKITMVGDRVNVKLNDVLVIDNAVLDNYWEPGKSAYSSGPIELQNHGSRLCFKNIYLREIPRGVADEASSADEKGLGGIRQLVQGDTLDGWRAEGSDDTPKWTVEGGVLTNYSDGPSLATTHEFGDFELHLEFSLPPKCNSGVFLRGRYEIQLLDSAVKVQGRPPQPVQRCGAIYGQSAPSRDVYKGPNQWNTLDVRVEGKTVTVRMNDATIIRSAKLRGVTAGASHSDDSNIGPIVLQSPAVTGAKFRNITITPR